MGSVQKAKYKKLKVKILLNKKRKIEKKLRYIIQVLSKNKNFAKEEITDGYEMDEDKNHPDQNRKSNLSSFAEVRKKLFSKLQDEVIENITTVCSSNTTYDVEAISLKIEQKALLACMQISIYERVMSDLFLEIQCATTSKFLHPIIVASPFKVLATQDSFPSLHTPDSAETTQMDPCREPPLTTPVAKVFPTTVIVETLRNESNDKILKPISLVYPRTKIEKEDDFIDNVEPGLNDYMTLCEDIQFDNIETTCDKGFAAEEQTEGADTNIENLMHILEGTEKEHTEELDNRLDQMRDLFGYEQSENPKDTSIEFPDSMKTVSNSHYSSTNIKLKIWRNERYIFMYKVLTRCANMTAARFYRTRKHFFSYFGDDSDYEEEDIYNDAETFLACCASRILPTVVKYVMPYYKKRRICGGSYIFKNLVRRIADSLVDVNYYPSEPQVKCYVEKFFPSGKKYMNVTDVWCYVLDEEFH